MNIIFLKAITTGGVTYNEKPWHRECFTCIGCKKQLAGQRFTSRENYPYCLECFSNLYAKKCVGCTKPITSKSEKNICMPVYLSQYDLHLLIKIQSLILIYSAFILSSVMGNKNVILMEKDFQSLSYSFYFIILLHFISYIP